MEKAQLLDTLVEQNGCSNGAELGILIARLRRRDQEHRLRHPDDGDRMQEDEDDEDDEDAIRSTAIRSSDPGQFQIDEKHGAMCAGLASLRGALRVRIVCSGALG